MVIDHFIEKIVEDSDRKIIGLKISAKDFLSGVNALADQYCSDLEISRSDFDTGKELFNTLNYYLKSDFKDILFRFLSEKDKGIAYNYYSESVAIISEQENKYPDFDAIVICEALVNILHLYGSLECDNNNIFTSSFEDYKKGSISSENASHSESRIGNLYFDEKIDMNKLIESYKIYDEIETIRRKNVRLKKEIVKDEKSWKRMMLAGKVAGLAIGSINIVAGSVAEVSFYLGAKRVGKRLVNNIEEGSDNHKIIYRFNYWRYILYAVYNYYRKNMGV